MSIFELLMLIAFGSAWPVSIYKSWKSRSNEGKSVFFLIILFLGYLSGIIHKLLYSYDWVIGIYILNSLLVGIDMLLYFRNRRLAKQSNS